MSDVIIFIRGGVFQGALANTNNNRIMVVDYDDEAEESRPRVFSPITVDNEMFQQILRNQED